MSKRISTSEKIVNEIFDNGLATSTWRMKNQDAYHALLEYREDIERGVRDVLIKNHKQLIKTFGEI